MLVGKVFFFHGFILDALINKYLIQIFLFPFSSQDALALIRLDELFLETFDVTDGKLCPDAGCCCFSALCACTPCTHLSLCMPLISETPQRRPLI